MSDCSVELLWCEQIGMKRFMIILSGCDGSSGRLSQREKENDVSVSMPTGAVYSLSDTKARIHAVLHKQGQNKL